MEDNCGWSKSFCAQAGGVVGWEGVCNGIYANTHLSVFVEYWYQLLNTDVVCAQQQNICENLVTFSW